MTAGFWTRATQNRFKEALAPFTDGDDPDVVEESLIAIGRSATSTGSVCEYSVSGEITEAFRTFHGLMESLADVPDPRTKKTSRTGNTKRPSRTSSMPLGGFVTNTSCRMNWQYEVYGWLSDTRVQRDRMLRRPRRLSIRRLSVSSNGLLSSSESKKTCRRTYGEGHRSSSVGVLQPSEQVMKQRTLREAIRDNQRHFKYERMLRQIRLRIYEYEDAGKLEKAQRVIAKCKAICGPRWEARQKLIQDRHLHRVWDR